MEILLLFGGWISIIPALSRPLYTSISLLLRWVSNDSRWSTPLLSSPLWGQMEGPLSGVKGLKTPGLGTLNGTGPFRRVLLKVAFTPRSQCVHTAAAALNSSTQIHGGLISRRTSCTCCAAAAWGLKIPRLPGIILTEHTRGFSSHHFTFSKTCWCALEVHFFYHLPFISI